MYEVTYMYGSKAQDTGRFAIEYIMAKHFHWTFAQTRETPTPVIEEFLLRITEAQKWERRRDETQAALQRARH